MNITKIHPMNLEPQGLRLWLYTNSLGAILLFGMLIYTDSVSGLIGKLTIVCVALFFSITLSVITVPLSTWLFERILPYPKSQRIILSCLATFLLWLVPAAAIGIVLDGFTADFTGILWLTSPQLAAAYVAAAVVYRQWLFFDDIDS